MVDSQQIMKTKWKYSEAKLCEATGISRTDLVKLRKDKLVKGKDWRKSKKGKGGSIEISQEGSDKILTAFEIKDANLDGARIDSINVVKPAVNAVDSTFNVVPRQEPDVREFKVMFIPSNRRLVRAKNGTGAEEWIIVPDNTKWAIGDALRAKISKHAGYFELVGKSPRHRGDRLWPEEFAKG